MLLHLCAVTNISEMGAGVMGGVLMWNVTSSRIPFKYLHMPRSAAVTSLRPTRCHIWGLPDLHAITCRALRHLRPPLLTLVEKEVCIGTLCLRIVNPCPTAADVGADLGEQCCPADGAGW